jgi:hypothetical protein
MLIAVVIIVFSLLGNFINPSSFEIPVTGNGGLKEIALAKISATDDLSLFTNSINNSDPDQLVGIYSTNALSYPVLQQPNGQASFVSSQDNVVTQFSTATQFNSIGIIAHNTLAGKQFFVLNQGQIITLVYGDGTLETYKVVEIREYQALSPTSPYSSFINLTDPGKTITYKELFFETYGLGNFLILQTCIAKWNTDSWGRLFIFAEKINTPKNEFRRN